MIPSAVVLVEFAHAAYTFNESDAITVTRVTVIKAGAINGSFDVQVVGGIYNTQDCHVFLLV